MSNIKQINSKIVYQNKWMTVREDNVQFPNGHQGIYGVVDKPDFAVIIPIVGQQICLVEQYRYALKARYWELPQGTWESKPDIVPENLARAELQEETGYRAGNIKWVGKQQVASGYSSQYYNIFLATDLTPGDTSFDPEEQDLISKLIPISEFENMIKNGTIKDATTISAWLTAKFKSFI